MWWMCWPCRDCEDVSCTHPCGCACAERECTHVTLGKDEFKPYLRIVVMLLKQKYIDLPCVYRNRFLQFHLSGAAWLSDMLRVILTAHTIDMNAQNKKCRTTLYYAVLNGKVECAELLLAQKNTRTNRWDRLFETSLTTSRHSSTLSEHILYDIMKERSHWLRLVSLLSTFFSRFRSLCSTFDCISCIISLLSSASIHIKLMIHFSLIEIISSNI